MSSIQESLQFFNEISHSQNILILNPKPDGDSIGASVALNKIIQKMGKKCTSFSAFQIPDYLGFIAEKEKMVVGEWKRLHTDHFDTIIMVDSCDLARIITDPTVYFSKSTRILCIDHHQTSKPDNVDLFIHDTTAESTCGLITDMCIDYKIEANTDLIDGEIAFALFTGLVADTDYFGYANVNTDTFERAAYLKAYGFDPIPIIKQFRESLGLKAFRFIQNNIQRVEINEKQRYAYLKVKKSDINFDENILVVNEAVNYVNRAIIRIIDCVDFSFVIREINDNRSSVAFRLHNNGNTKDLSKIAQHFGGGGHQQSAGAQVDMNVDELERKLVQYLDKN